MFLHLYCPETKYQEASANKVFVYYYEIMLQSISQILMNLHLLLYLLGCIDIQVGSYRVDPQKNIYRYEKRRTNGNIFKINDLDCTVSSNIFLMHLLLTNLHIIRMLWQTHESFWPKLYISAKDIFVFWFYPLTGLLILLNPS